MKKNIFTLMELLVVIAIIAILLTLLLPSLSKARYMARIAVCASNISQNGKGALMFAKNNDMHFPETNDSKPYNSYTIKEGKNHYNHGVLAKQEYVTVGVLFCPQMNVESLQPPFVKEDYQAGTVGYTVRHQTIYSEIFNTQDGEIVKRKGESRSRSSYNFLPIQGRYANNWVLPKYENNQIFFIDSFISKTRTAHKKYFKAWNVLKIDNSMKLVKSSEAFLRLEYSNVTQWPTINDISDILTR